jgi:hypothetical protein
VPHPDIVFIYGKHTETLEAQWTEWLTVATNKTLMIATPTWMEKLRLNAAIHEFVLATTEMYQRYPFLPDLTEKNSEIEWILSISQLMRFHKIVAANPGLEDYTEGSVYKGKIQVIDTNAAAETTVPPIWLIQQYFVPPKAARAREIRQTLEKNVACPLIDKIVLLNEKSYDLPESPKIQQVTNQKRLTYKDILVYVKNHVPKDTIVVFSNSDIYMDSTLRALYAVDLNKKFLALLRYETAEDPKVEPKLFGPRPDSQDTWILWSTSIDFEPSDEDFGFNFGVSGCDNTITLSMLRKRFVVSNPALSIRTYHVHASNIRTYEPANVLDKPMFLYVEPTGIQEYFPQTDLKQFEDKKWLRPQYKSFPRTIKYVDKPTADTICNMMRRDSHYTYSTDSSNTFNQGLGEHDNKLYTFTGTKFTIPTGVVCDFDNLYIGDHHAWKDEWSKVPLTVLTNTVHIPEMLALHFTLPMINSAAKWFLHYLPSALEVRKHVKSKPEFIIPVHPDTQRVLNMLKWPETDGEVTIIPFMNDCQFVSEKVHALTPFSFHDVPQEHIELLRSMLPPREERERPVAVLVAERKKETLATRDWCEQVVKNIFHRRDRGNWEVTIIDADMPTEQRLKILMSADLLIAQSECEWDALEWVWMMKPNATVVEMMPDTKPRGDHIHIANAANLNYVLLGVKREPLPYQCQHALEDIEKIINEHLFSEALKAQVPNTHLPLIILPSGKALQGIHDHSGDTFREMVKIWEERKYVRVERREDTPYVWWGGIGEVLLYDRPTLRWWNNPSYKLALYGNVFPEKPGPRDSTWSFWGRSPRAIESMVATNKHLTKYEDRQNPSIFLGRIENGVQNERRTKHDWSKAVTFFSMPVDSTGGPYKFTQPQYLEKLSQSRFGLCLPGYGPKCNREIEYFAMGTVPIVTPGVDMKHYQLPPQEGVHYFTASSPEEVKALVSKTTPEKWTEMSIAGRAWWRRYASAEGLFRFTWGIINHAADMIKVQDVMDKR